MEINATVIVQAFNFFVAYLMFRVLFFKPAYAALAQEKKEEDHLNAVIDQREKKLEQTEEQKQEAWREFQVQFAESLPDVNSSLVKYPKVELRKSQDVLTDQEAERLVREVQEAIVKKVPYDN